MFMLADPSYVDGATPYRFDDAGKMMALAAYGQEGTPAADEKRLIDWVLGHPDIVGGSAKAALSDSPYFNIGVRSEEFYALARAHSNAILDRFMTWARKNLQRDIPLVIGGGCGLNCDWNSAWAKSGLFSDVFVPPCTNDSGSAIGTAIQAQQNLAGSASVQWNVYCGSRERDRYADLNASGVTFEAANVDRIVDDLCRGQVVAVMRGRCEIGPRALGARSLLADPRDAAMLNRLNRIKQREAYRPIAPICIVEAADTFFDMPVKNKYMLYLAKVRDPRIPAVTHVDNSARVQVVSEADNSFVWKLVSQFGIRTGVPVLGNTSLNLKGRGFIDEVADLIRFCRDHGVQRAVCDDWYLHI
jgi:hydroxymethyl cephem carbamoyltransferase